MTNLHVVMNSFRHESRILKETSTLVRSGLVKRVHIAALHEDGLPEREAIDAAREVWRARLRSRGWPRMFFLQLFKYIEYCARVFFHARPLGVKLINVHDVDLLPLGAFMKRAFGAKLVYDPHELETEKRGLRGVRQAVARLVERVFIGHADLVVVVGDGIKNWYRDRYGVENIAAVLNCPESRDAGRTRRLREELGIPDGKRIVIYQGGLARGRGVESLLKAFAECGDDRYALVFMGYGELEPLVREYAASHGGIFLKEAVEPAMVLSYTASADVGVSFIEDVCLSYNLCLPNKLFEYVMAGLPVIVNDLPEMRRVVEKYRIGVVLGELDAQSLRRGLERLETMDRDVLAGNLKRAASVFSWGNQEPVMVEAYKRHVFVP